MSDAGPFDFDALVSRLRTSTRTGEAQQLAHLLLDHVFGAKGFMSFAEDSGRHFPVEGWNNEQRQVLQALAACDAAWPMIAYALQEALELDFEPKQEELRAALARPAGAAPEPDSPAPAASAEPKEAAVLAAVRRLADSFASEGHNLHSELERFAPFRPAAGVGVPLLVEQLRTGDLKERRAAAWALGRLGSVARSAVPALFEAWRGDQKNEYAHLALANIGLDDFEPLIALMRGKSDEMGVQARWVFGAMKGVPDDIVQRLLADADAELRRSAVSKLRFEAAVEHVPQLLQLLDDPDEWTAGQARYGLHDAGPRCIPAIMEAAAGASRAKRRLLAQVLADFSQHLLPQTPRLAEWLLQEADAEVRIDLLRSLSRLASVSPDVVATLAQIASTDARANVREQVLRTIGRLGAAELVPTVLRVMETDSDTRIRAIAVEVLRSFRRPAKEILAALDRALASPLQPVRLQAVWALYYRGAEGVPLLQEHLKNAQDERVTAEMAWVLGLLKAKSITAALQSIQRDGKGLAACLAGWAVERIQGDA